MLGVDAAQGKCFGAVLVDNNCLLSTRLKLAWEMGVFGSHPTRAALSSDVLCSLVACEYSSICNLL